MKKFLIFLSFSSVAYGQSATTIIDDSVSRFGTVLKRVEELLTPSFTWLFWSLVIISFAWSALQWVLDQTELKSFISVLVKKILFIGFASYAFTHAGEISGIIIESFKKLAGIANNGTAISPSYVFAMAIDLMQKVNTALGFNTTSIFLLVIAVVILICYALIAGTMVVTLVECQFVAIINLMLFSFGGSEFTTDYAKASWRYSISVGVKTFFIFLMGAVAQGILKDTMEHAKIYDIPMLASLLASSAILLLIITQIPQNVQSVIAGVTLTGNFNAVQAASQIAANAVTTAAGGAKLATEVGKYANAQSGGSLGGFAKHAGIAIGKAVMSEFSNRATGNPKSKHGTFAGRMGAEIGQMNQNLSGAKISGSKSSSSENTKEKNRETTNEKTAQKEAANIQSRQGATSVQSSPSSGGFSQSKNGVGDSDLAFRETALSESDASDSVGGYKENSQMKNSNSEFSSATNNSEYTAEQFENSKNQQHEEV